MKKFKFIFLVLVAIAFMQNVEAKECSSTPSSEWQFAKTTYKNFRNLQNETDTEKIICCEIDDPNVWTCDYYQKDSPVDNANTTNTSTTTSSQNFCENSNLKPTFVLIGHVVRMAKILLPIIIIGFGMVDFFKAVVGSKDDDIKKSAKTLLFRCIAGVCIFFLPAIINLIFSWVDGWSANYEQNYNSCFKCIWDVGSCT